MAITRVKGLALILALILTLSSVITSFGSPAPRAVAPAGAVTLADWQFPDTLNPLQTHTDSSRRILDLLWDPLVRFDDQSRPFGDLVTDVPTVQNGRAVVQNGKLTVLLTLRPGLHWSDGSPLTSSDVFFGWKVYSDPAAGPACSGTCDAISSIKLLNSLTAVVTFSGVYGNYLERLPAVLPAHAFTSVSAAATTLASDSAYNYENSTYVTSGPYQISEFAPGDHITLIPNPQYSALPGPYLSNVIFRYFASRSDMMAAAASGQVDESERYTIQDLPALQKVTGVYTIPINPSYDYEQLLYNTGMSYKGVTNPLSNTSFRQALGMSVDRKALCKSVLGLSATQCARLAQEGPISPVSAVPVSPHGSGYDLAGAKKLLAASGYANHNVSVDLVVPSGDSIRMSEATFIASSWNALGVHANVQPTDANTLFDTYDHGGTLARGAFQVALFAGNGTRYPDALVRAFGSAHIPSAGSPATEMNYGRVNDRQIDADFATAATSADAVQRQQSFADLDGRIVSQAYMLALYSIPTITTTNGKLGYFAPGPAGTSWNGFEWYSIAAHPAAPPKFTIPGSAPLVKTHVCGTLSGSTTWDTAHSPYGLDCNVVVPNGASLTVQPGVTVFALAGSGLQISGSLTANGTGDNRIIFEPCVGCSIDTASWMGIHFMSGADPSSSVSALDVSGATVGLQDYPGSALSNASFEFDTIGIAATLGSARSLSISGTLLENDATGISLHMAGGSFSAGGSTIVGNHTGATVVLQSGDVHFNNDNIFQNVTHVSTSGSSSTSVDAANSWWGTTDTAAIHARNHDCSSDTTLPCVAIDPVLSSAACGVPVPLSTVSPAGGSCSAPVATSTPTETATGTATDTPGPTDTPTDVVSATPTDTPVDSSGGAATDTPTDTPTGTLTVTPTPRATPTGTLTVTPTPTGTLTDTPTDTPGTVDATATDTPVPTATTQPGSSITLNPSTLVADGTSVSVSGAGFGANESVTVSYPAILATGKAVPEEVTTTTDSDGTFSVGNLAVPSNIVPGNYQVAAVGGTSHAGAIAWLTVSDPNTVQTVTDTPTPGPTDTPAPTDTPTPDPTFTPTPTSTPVPRPSISIDRVEVLHDEAGAQKSAKILKLGEWSYFIAVFHLDNPGRSYPTGRLLLTRNGKSIGSYVMAQTSFHARDAFGAKLRFFDKKQTGKLYAHFVLSIGPTTVKRDRRFDIKGH